VAAVETLFEGVAHDAAFVGIEDILKLGIGAKESSDQVP